MIVQTIVGAVLLFSAPCPDIPDAAACVYFEEPPVIYIDPSISRRAKAWSFQHELGHIVAWHTPGASIHDETFANRYATCHTPHPRWWRIGRKCWRWGVMP